MPSSGEVKQEVRNLLHYASAPHIKPSWESGFKTTNLRTNEDVSTDIENKEAWTKVDTISELMMALDNYVAAWAIFWPHDRSATTLRRTVTNLKEFPTSETNTKALEINTRRACQDETPMTFKESCDLAKEYLDSPTEFTRDTTNKQFPSN